TLGIPHSSVALIESSGVAFRLASPAEGVADLEQGGVLPFPSTVLSEVVKGSEPRYRSDLRAESTDYEVDRKLIAAGYLSDYLVPLTHEGECIGTLNCASPNVDGIPEDTRRLVRLLAPRLAGYIANARLFDELEASERRLRTLISNLPGAVYRRDADDEWSVQFVSDEMERLTGYPAGDFRGGAGWTYSSLVHPDDLERVRRIVADAVERKEPYVLEYRIVTAEGREKWVYEKGRAEYGEDGAPLWLDGATFDVTDRKLAEQALKESETLLVEAQRIGRVASWDWDVARDRLTITQELHNLLGTDEATFTPNAASFLERVHPEDRERVAERMNAALKRDEPYNVQFRLEQPGGAVVHLHSIGHVDRDDGGKAARMVGMVQDISDRIRAEEERRQLENQMRESQKLESLGVLAGGIAHDFNNLLVSVLGGTELALQYIDSSSPAREHLEDVMTAADRAADLANQMLAYSGKGQFMVEPTDLSVLIREISQLVEVSVSKKIRVALELAEDLPAVQVDVTQIRQIALNLVTNAAEAIGDKAGTISIATGSVHWARDYLAEGYAADEARDGVYVYMEVTDSGAGMDSQTRENIFDPFFTTKSTGRGLGLAAVLGIVRGHKGAIRVESEPNLGTTIRVLLPASDQTPTQRAPEPVPDEEWQGNGTILLADDEPTVRSVAHAMLSRLGFKVLVAEDGKEGVEMFRRHADEIVLVVLDLAMPTMGGEEAFREIRRIKSDAKVVLSSGFTEQDTTNRFADRGLAGFIQKPYRLAELTRTIRAALES
ncbi:MAG: PAS domain-containing protein, partial [bacterium]|nr:PAS domain-containing protein [bacterium]